MPEQITLFIDALDDQLQPDGMPSFEGGQYSNNRPNLLKPTESIRLTNCDIDKRGRVRTRRGTIRIGDGPVATSTEIQGLTSFQTPAYNYIVAANNRRIYQFDGTTLPYGWAQIALGGTGDDEPLFVFRKGVINHTGFYDIGETSLVVDGMVGYVRPGEKLYFTNNLKTDWFEYIIKSVDAGANTTLIELEEPGLVFKVYDNWGFYVKRPAKVSGNWPAGAKFINIDTSFDGQMVAGEKFVIPSENLTHTVTGHNPVTGGLTFDDPTGPGLRGGYIAPLTTTQICFAQGNDMIFWADGASTIWGWNGKTTFNAGAQSILDFLDQSNFVRNQTTPPAGVKVIVWFQSRLIATGIASEPDAVYFSDFLDPTSWDKDFQQIRIGGGESDPITGLTPWTDLNLIVWKKNAIYVVNCDPSQNPNPEDPTLLVNSFAIRTIHKRIGCPAWYTAIQVGGGSTSPGSDVFFLDGDKYVRSIRRVLAAENQQEAGEAVSFSVQDIFDRINITYINRCVAWYHKDHYFIAIPLDGSTRPNVVMVYNLLTQSWCGPWGAWYPTAFNVRTDVLDYNKLIIGRIDGRVIQWLDDLSAQDETQDTYEDYGFLIPTQIKTRSFTLGDPFSPKTGLSAEFEFDESIAVVTIKAILDGRIHSEPVAAAFSTATEPPLILPFILPDPPTLHLPASPGAKRWTFDLQRYGQWRELQFFITSDKEKLSLRSIRITGWIDSMVIQDSDISGTPAS